MKATSVFDRALLIEEGVWNGCQTVGVTDLGVMFPIGWSRGNASGVALSDEHRAHEQRGPEGPSDLPARSWWGALEAQR